MTIKINPEMVTLAREYRGLTQEQLGQKIGVTQATIAKVEGGLKGISDAQAEMLSHALDFPIGFFQQKEELLGFGSSAYYYRKKATISALDRKRIQGQVNLMRIHLKHFLRSIDIEASRSLPSYDLEDEFNGSSSQAAISLRTYWNLPDGPIKNLTALIESAGVIVAPICFGTNSISATSIRLNELPPIIFLNSDMPGDRWRFTLAHELAHLVLHPIPKETMEDEADEFAAEFLLPEIDLKPQFLRMGRIRLHDLSILKPYWKVSMQALLMRAYALDAMNKSEFQYLWRQIAKNGYRMSEPNPLPKEIAKTYSDILSFFERELNFSKEEIAETLHVTPREVELLHGTYGAWQNRGRHLKVV